MKLVQKPSSVPVRFSGLVLDFSLMYSRRSAVATLLIRERLRFDAPIWKASFGQLKQPKLKSSEIWPSPLLALAARSWS